MLNKKPEQATNTLLRAVNACILKSHFQIGRMGILKLHEVSVQEINLTLKASTTYVSKNHDHFPNSTFLPKSISSCTSVSQNNESSNNFL
jgi:hypothetical protein